jgi:hypothetical protein
MNLTFEIEFQQACNWRFNILKPNICQENIIIGTYPSVTTSGVRISPKQKIGDIIPIFEDITFL